MTTGENVVAQHVFDRVLEFWNVKYKSVKAFMEFLLMLVISPFTHNEQ